MADGSEVRTTLTGKPLDFKHDVFASMMPGNISGAGANLLPRGYTDTSLVSIPTKNADIESEPVKREQKRSGFFRRLSNAVQDKSDATDNFKIVSMSRGDYLKYWAKGEDGQFLPNVEEPPEGRKEWVRVQLVLNKQWKMNDKRSGK